MADDGLTGMNSPPAGQETARPRLWMPRPVDGVRPEAPQLWRPERVDVQERRRRSCWPPRLLVLVGEGEGHHGRDGIRIIALLGQLERAGAPAGGLWGSRCPAADCRGAKS